MQNEMPFDEESGVCNDGFSATTVFTTTATTWVHFATSCFTEPAANDEPVQHTSDNLPETSDIEKTLRRNNSTATFTSGSDTTSESNYGDEEQLQHEKNRDTKEGFGFCNNRAACLLWFGIILFTVIAGVSSGFLVSSKKNASNTSNSNSPSTFVAPTVSDDEPTGDIIFSGNENEPETANPAPEELASPADPTVDEIPADTWGSEDVVEDEPVDNEDPLSPTTVDTTQTAPVASPTASPTKAPTASPTNFPTASPTSVLTTVESTIKQTTTEPLPPLVPGLSSNTNAEFTNSDYSVGVCK